MKLYTVVYVACAAIGTSLAQNVPEQFVVSGKTAEKIQDFTTVNLATAERISEVCENAAAAEGVGISIMVLDKDGNHVYMDRMDGQGYLNIATAEMKARTALLLRAPSKNLMNNLIQDPTRELQYMQFNEFANSGGLPIVVNKQMIGVVGVGGSAPRVPVWSDEICAHKALTEVIGPSVAPLVEDIPPRPNPNPGNAPVPRFTSAGVPKSNLPRNLWSGARVQRMCSTAIRSRSPQPRKSLGCAAIGRLPRAARCRSTFSTMPANSFTWSTGTARSITMSSRLF
jgi:glc operon protein GlcG